MAGPPSGARLRSFRRVRHALEENLIEAINIIASLFYGVVLGMFLVAFFLKHVRGTAVFWAALGAEALIFALFFLRNAYPALKFSYLWYNLIGCAACVVFSLLLQAVFGDRSAAPRPPTYERTR
jgi:SSS family solute:Na+ symporter